MPTGYVVTLTLVAVCTAAAVLPVRGFSRPRYFLALVANEVPHVAALWLALATVLALREGDLSGPLGVLLTIGAGLVLLGLGELVRRCLQAPGAVDRAAGSGGRHRTRGLLRPTLFPFPWRPRVVTRHGPHRYGDHPRQRLDVYRRRGQDTPGPVLVYLHGGGYTSGSNRREGRALLHHLARRGWLCVSATYRLRPEADFADHLGDARAVLRWAHEHAATLGGDPSALVMAGSSAGAHLTALCALTQEESNPDRPRVDAALCLYGYYGRYYGRGADEQPVSTPLALDPRTAPPFFLAHGDHDSYTPVEDARRLHQHLRSASPSTTWYVELPGAQHGFDALQSWRITAVIDGIDAFLARVGISPTHLGAADPGRDSA